MNVKEENICRLCLNVADNDFEVIDEITKKIFADLALKVNLDVSKDPIICKDCANVVKKCSNFKSDYIITEKFVFSFAIEKKRATFEMKDIYKDEKDEEAVDDNFICRFCSNYCGSKFVLLDTLMNNVTFVEMLRRLMPDMDINIIMNPIICTTCQQDLECYSKFVEKCLDVEEKITKYLQNQGSSSSSQVKLSEIPGFVFKNDLEMDFTKEHVIKQEVKLEDIDGAHSVGYDGGLIKTEEIDIKNEVKFDKTAWEASPEIYKCDMQSSMISSETRMGNANKMKYEDEVDKKTNQMLSSENTSEQHIFKCAMCIYKTKYKSSLIRHMLIHKNITEVEMYKCSMCTYETRHKRSLKTHMLIHKNITEVEMYKCAMCSYETKHKGRLKIHMVIHKDITEVDIYKCSMCPYQAKQKNSLRRHMITHKDVTEVKMYKCSMCTYQTKQKNSLKRHILIHKDITELEMNKCTICTFETKHKRSLKNHMLIHKDIAEVEMCKCAICSFETKHKCSLVKHMLTHKDITEVEIYKCSMCTYETKYKRNLGGHTLVHKNITEVEMYKCLMCTYETKHKRSLRRHILIHKLQNQSVQ